MSGKNWLAALCLVLGIVTAAYGLSHGLWPLALLGIVLVLVFWYLAFQWLADGGRPMGAEAAIKPAANPAWTLKDQPAAGGNAVDKATNSAANNAAKYSTGKKD